MTTTNKERDILNPGCCTTIEQTQFAIVEVKGLKRENELKQTINNRMTLSIYLIISHQCATNSSITTTKRTNQRPNQTSVNTFFGKLVLTPTRIHVYKPNNCRQLSIVGRQLEVHPRQPITNSIVSNCGLANDERVNP